MCRRLMDIDTIRSIPSQPIVADLTRHDDEVVVIH